MDEEEAEEMFMQFFINAARNDDADGGNEEYEGQPCPVVDTERWRRLGDPTFKSHFRMSRILYEILYVKVGNHMEATHRLDHPGMALDLSLLMTLWTLATPDSFRSVGVTFGLAKGSVHNQYKKMIAVLRELKDEYICWPSNREMAWIAREFEERFGYPSVVGCTDGCHLRTTAPLEQPQRYVNRHHDYSVILQGTCDHRLVFRDVFIGQPGSVGDSRTFRRSPLGKYILRNQNFMVDYHLLADGAYTLTDKVLIPYRNYGNMTIRQRRHNRFLSSCRSCIERAFALLKNKWRRLKSFHTLNPDYFMDAAMSCLVLHNFILLEGQEYEYEGVHFDDADLADGLYAQLIVGPKARGLLKREYIATMLTGEE